MVRAGIILYGLYPSEEMPREELDLLPVMSLTSHITYIKTVAGGEGISYGHTLCYKEGDCDRYGSCRFTATAIQDFCPTRAVF